MPVKDIQLKILEDEIKKTIPNHWLFPTDEVTNVKGFWGEGGTRKIMFVAERPSLLKTGKDNYRKSFYTLLKKLNLEDSHITDLVKSQGKKYEPYPKDLANDWRFFKREINIVEPDLVFALGDKVHSFILFPLAEKGIKLIRIDHYSHIFRYGKQDKLEMQIKNALLGGN